MRGTNREIVQAALDAVTRGDIDALMNTLADDVKWTFFGSHRFAGTFHGKDALLTGLFAVIGEVLEDGIRLDVRSISADGERVVVEAKGRARSKQGLEYNNDYCLVFDLADGRIRHVREYLDTALVTRVFGQG